MKVYSKSENYVLIQGDMLDMTEVIKPNTIDAIVCDPPYELNFMGKGWDNAGVSFQTDTWNKCYDALKPGGYLLAFGGSRTFHRIACAIEDAGFEIRDTIMWLYGSGFPKSSDISKQLDKKEGNVRQIIGYTNNAGIAKNVKPDSTGSHIWTGNLTSNKAIGSLAKKWQGWGTALKPAYEPIIVARKPFKGSCVDNVIKYGVGGINIDECKVGDEKRTQFSGRSQSKTTVYNSFNQDNAHMETVAGRFPANVILDSKDGEDWRRYFYCAKASKKDRDEGLEEFEEKDGIRSNAPRVNEEEKTKPRKNTHPTVKPTTLMQYLVRLVTPKGGTVLDPFMGSGSTGKAVMYENKERNAGYKFVGIELTEEYLPIAEARIKFAQDLMDEEERILNETKK